MFTVLIPTAGAPVFLDHQIRLLRRFSAESLDIVVVNDARPFAHPSNWMDGDAVIAINEVCALHRVTVLRTPERWTWRPRSPSERTADALNFGFSHVRSSAQLAIIDADMFPVAPFSFGEILNGADIAGIIQTRGNARYPWNGFLLLKASSLPDANTIDFSCTRWPRTDTGGKMSGYLERHPTVTVQNLDHLGSGCWNDFSRAKELPTWLTEFVARDPCNVGGSFFSEVYADKFFHFRSGGNWQSILGDKAQKYSDRYSSFVASLASA